MPLQICTKTKKTNQEWPHEFEYSQYLKITEKVSFEIASEASYFYILSEQKLTKNAKIGPSSQFLSTYTKKSLMT